jgi:hypothetical protein
MTHEVVIPPLQLRAASFLWEVDDPAREALEWRKVRP